MEKKPPVLTLRPQFNSLLAALESLAAAVVGATALMFIGGTLFLALISALGLGRYISGGGIYGVFFILGLAAVPPLYYEIKRKAYNRSIYNFYDDYLEFQHFQYLLNKRVGRIGYREITNVAEHANFVQQHEKLTSLYLFVPSMGYQSRGVFSGLKMADIAQSNQLTGKILDLIDRSRQQTPPAAAQRAAAPA